MIGIGTPMANNTIERMDGSLQLPKAGPERRRMRRVPPQNARPGTLPRAANQPAERRLSATLRCGARSIQG